MARPTKQTKTTKPQDVPQEAAEIQEENIQDTSAPASPQYKLKLPACMTATNQRSLLDEDLTTERSFWKSTAQFADGFKMMSEIYRDYLPLPHMQMQYLLRRIGLPVQSIYEFTGEENVGKSSLMTWLCGYWATFNIPSLYINTDPKVMDVSWAERIVNQDKKTAKKIMEKAIRVLEHVYTFDDMEKAIVSWAKFQREEQKRPMTTPIVVVVDQISKLLNAKEAASLALDSKTQHTLISEAGNLTTITAKYMHALSRILSPYMYNYNMTVLVVSSTNTPINMQAGPSIFASSVKNNTCRIGGRALPQSEALLVTMTKTTQQKTGDTVIGTNVNMRIKKNSYGANVQQDAAFLMRNTQFTDTEDKQECPIDMDYHFCDTLSQLKIWGVEQTKRRFTCDKLGLVAVTAATLYAKIASDDALRSELGVLLGIHGYEAIQE